MVRPALEALAEQQKTIERQASQIEALRRHAVQRDGTIQRMGGMIERLAAGVEYIAGAAGITGKVATAMLPKQADVQNPAQPIPEPPAQPAPFSTVETKTPEAQADVNAPGLVPGSTQDVAADVTSTTYTPGEDIPGPAFKNLVDVTAPVEGTQGPQPLGDVKTLTDVRVGNPMTPDVAFPLRGDFANAQRTGSRQGGSDTSNRTYASLRLARLRIEAGTTQNTEDLAEAAAIEKDASLSMEAIQREITTLENVKTAAGQRMAARQTPPPGLVPRSASAARRSVPSMQGSITSTAVAVAADSDTADSDLFD